MSDMHERVSASLQAASAATGCFTSPGMFTRPPRLSDDPELKAIFELAEKARGYEVSDPLRRVLFRQLSETLEAATQAFDNKLKGERQVSLAQAELDRRKGEMFAIAAALEGMPER
jgi:hypothetical protein